MNIILLFLALKQTLNGREIFYQHDLQKNFYVWMDTIIKYDLALAVQKWMAICKGNVCMLIYMWQIGFNSNREISPPWEWVLEVVHISFISMNFTVFIQYSI